MNDDPRHTTLRDFYRAFYNERRFDDAARHLHATFVNHHPGANGTGPHGMIDDFTRLGPPPSFRIEPLRMVSDGALVWVLSRATGVGEAGGLSVDVWRFEGQQLAEHWDVFRRLSPSEDAARLVDGLRSA